MRKDRVRAHCPRCRHQQLFIRATINHVLHLVLSIVTGGLWLVSWGALCIGMMLRPWRCEHCGWHKPEFRDPAVEPPHSARASKPAAVSRLHPEHSGPFVRGASHSRP